MSLTVCGTINLRFPVSCKTKHSKLKRNFLGFKDLANFWFDFSVFALIKCTSAVFMRHVVCRFFPNLSLVFRFFVNNDGSFPDLSVQCMPQVLWFAKFKDHAKEGAGRGGWGFFCKNKLIKI